MGYFNLMSINVRIDYDAEGNYKGITSTVNPTKAYKDLCEMGHADELQALETSVKHHCSYLEDYIADACKQLRNK